MKCEICGNEFEGVCEICGFEDEVILDSEYYELFEKKKEILKKNYLKKEELEKKVLELEKKIKLIKGENKKFDEFIERMIQNYQKYLKENLEIAKIFIDDIVDILRHIDKKNYIEFLLAKFFVYKRLSLDTSEIENELKKLELNDEQKRNFNLIKVMNG